MNKTELVAAAATAANVPKSTAEAVINATLATICEALAAGDKVQLMGFGCFEVKQRATRKSFNPHSGTIIQVPEHKKPVYRAGKTLLNAVNSR